MRTRSWKALDLRGTSYCPVHNNQQGGAQPTFSILFHRFLHHAHNLENSLFCTHQFLVFHQDTLMAPRPEPFQALVAEDDATPLSLDLRVPSPTSVLTTAEAQVVVLVDPMSSGVKLQQKLFETNLYKMIIVWSNRSQPAAREKHFKKTGRSKVEFLAVLTCEGDDQLDATLTKILDAAAGLPIAAVLCGSEFGVLLEDAIAKGLNERLGSSHLRPSGMPQPTTKVDKHMQANALQAHGLAAVREKLARSEDDVHAFLKENAGADTEFVVKPQTGAGSVGVMFADSPEAVLEAYRKIMKGEHKAHVGDKYRHYEEAGVLLQEKLTGIEYVVDAVVNNGFAKVTAIWKYDKRPCNGAAFVTYSKELQVMEDPNCQEIVDYTEQVLEAVGFNSGAIHAEVMYTVNRGPVLVELNCRMHGGDGAWVQPAEICMGYSQLSILMDVYLQGGKQFENIPSRPFEAKSWCQQAKMRSYVEGTLKQVIPSQWERITSLPSFYSHMFGVKEGDQIIKTVDMPSVPGEITLVHSDKNQLAKDYQLMNEILEEGIFEIEQ